MIVYVFHSASCRSTKASAWVWGWTIAQSSRGHCRGNHALQRQTGMNAHLLPPSLSYPFPSSLLESVLREFSLSLSLSLLLLPFSVLFFLLPPLSLLSPVRPFFPSSPTLLLLPCTISLPFFTHHFIRDEGLTRRMQNALARTLVGPQRFTSGSVQAVDSPNFRCLSNMDASAHLHRGRFRLHFAGAWAKGKRSSQNRLAASGFPENFRQFRRGRFHISKLICQISRLIFDRRHVHASHTCNCCKMKSWQLTMGHCCGMKSSMCAQCRSRIISNLRKEKRLESVNKGKGGMEIEKAFL